MEMIRCCAHTVSLSHNDPFANRLRHPSQASAHTHTVLFMPGLLPRTDETARPGDGILRACRLAFRVIIGHGSVYARVAPSVSPLTSSPSAGSGSVCWLCFSASQALAVARLTWASLARARPESRSPHLTSRSEAAWRRASEALVALTPGSGLKTRARVEAGGSGLWATGSDSWLWPPASNWPGGSGEAGTWRWTSALMALSMASS